MIFFNRFLNHVRKIKTSNLLPFIIGTLPLFGYGESYIAIAGGDILEPFQPPSGYIAFVSPAGEVTNPTIDLTGFNLKQVALNSSGQGLVSGQLNGACWAAGVNNGIVTPFDSINVRNGIYRSVAINEAGYGIIGGYFSGGTDYPYVNTVSPTGEALFLGVNPPFIAPGEIYSVGINNSNQIIVAGDYGQPQRTFFAVYFKFGEPGYPSVDFSQVLNSERIDKVALNDSGRTIFGGITTAGAPCFAVATPENLVAVEILTLPTSGAVNDIAINNSGYAIAGGEDSVNSLPFAIVIDPDNTTTVITLGNFTGKTGIINSVSINESGVCLVGGLEEPNFSPDPYPYLAFIDADKNLFPVDFNGMVGEIYSVAINSLGQGLIGGNKLSDTYTRDLVPYLAIVSPTGVITELEIISTRGEITSIALAGLFNVDSRLPTSILSGNNLIYANYVNQYSPQTAIYFTPALLAGTYEQAVEAAAPTRNGISFYTQLNNLFFLSTSLSTHLREKNVLSNNQGQKLASGYDFLEDQLTASLDSPNSSSKKSKIGKRTLWAEAIGAFAYQKAQDQTPAFNPASGGFITGIDYQVSPNLLVGGGFSYLYTHIDEKNNMGFSNIHQEDFFLYATWKKNHFYLDGSFWGGMFQTHQKRNIQITGFTSQSISNPSGGNLVPHFEAGFNLPLKKTMSKFLKNFNPFFMLDWANGWQGGYSETGKTPFNVSQLSQYSSLLRLETGLRLYETHKIYGWNLILQEKGSYVRTQSFQAGQVTAFLVGSPGLFTVETLTANANLGVFQFMATLEPINPSSRFYPTLSTFYQGQFGNNYFSNQVNLEFTWKY
ncbi:MAG: autotransporter outer membrane beta-barrel domain-containing protein [Chlamydiia bacterium]